MCGTPEQLVKRIYQFALDSGYDDCGIIPIHETREYQVRLKERMEKIPEASGFYSLLQEGMNTEMRFPWAKSMIICTYWYGQYCYPSQLQGKYAKAFFLSPEGVRDSKDYKNLRQFPSLIEGLGIRIEGGSVGGLRNAAVKAGLGIIRRNNFLYTEKGSWVELHGFVIDQELSLYQHHELKPCPEKCTVCRKSCPTGSLSAPYTMNPLRCVSFLNTFGKNRLPDDIPKEQLGLWIIGCDACQDKCPYNKHDWLVGRDFPGLSDVVPLLNPETLSEATDEIIRKDVVPRTADHIKPDETNTVRESVMRYLQNTSKKGN